MVKKDQRRNLSAEPKIPLIAVVLNDPSRLGEIEDLVSTGASIGTIEASLGLHRGQLRKWLTRGEQKPRSPYGTLFQMYRKWAASARAAAEAQQLAKNPSQWLERNTSAKLLDTDEGEITPVAATALVNATLQVGTNQMLQALAKLREAGISLDSAVDKGELQITPTLNAPKDISNDDTDN